jgi:RHS repeat-associated protein
MEEAYIVKAAKQLAVEAGANGGHQSAELITWLFEPESFTPLAKLTKEASFDILTDHLGTPLSMHKATGEAVWSADLNAYGQVLNLRGKADDCPFRFPGQYEDVETGLYYNRFRYYDAKEGMYVSQDPIGLLGGSRLYGYVRNPLIGIDPYGLAEWVNPNTINFSQAFVEGETIDYEQAMRMNKKDGGWDWHKFPDSHPDSSALKVAEVDGQLVSFNNRRLLAAQNAKLSAIPVVRVDLADIKPGTTITWGESLKRRFNSSPDLAKYPKIQLPKKGTPNKPQVCH